ncbi:MAG: deoxyribonuclease IV [Candidatus Nanohaloarchaeota archaeon QJJ-9]|nr:deoxyribonuclease IV [Candidatus Nanohaloarchaeota archaeon QJJ-9]
MFRIGGHVSISGGYPEAVNRQGKIGGNCGQIFPGSPRGWKVSKPSKKEAEEFKNACKENNIKPWVVHATYLINLATPKDDLAKKSVKAVQEEINAAAKLGIEYYVFHPGAHTGAGIEEGIENVASRLSKLDIPENVTVLLENTAGKGTTIGKTFESLDRMVQKSSYGYDKLGICLDTCHMYAAGYDFSTEKELESLVDKFDSEIGLKNLHVLHLNDSKNPLESEKDEHADIGKGYIGEKSFKLLLSHKKLKDKPMVLETPDSGKGYQWNIEKCRELREK